MAETEVFGSRDEAPRYHNTSSAYCLPNDSAEHQRLEFQSEAYEKLMFDAIFQSPVDNPKRILEIGCGTGRSTVKLAKKFPGATIIGVDLSPVPDVHQKPDNVEYIQGDVRDLIRSCDSNFQPGSYDYVYSRLLVLGMTDWPSFMKQCISLLAPGGWLEYQETDINLKDKNGDSIKNKSMYDFHYLGTAKELDFVIAQKLQRMLKDAGLENVHEKRYMVPLFPTPDAPETEMIQKIAANYPTALGSMFDQLGAGVCSPEEIAHIKQNYVKQNSQESRNPGDHFDFCVFSARNPSS